MGFTSPEGATPPTDERGLDGLPPAAQEGPSFGQQLGNYAQNRFPIMGGLAEQIFGGGQQAQAPPQMQGGGAPLPPQDDLIAMNAKPPVKEGGGGLEMLMKLFGGG